VAAAHAAAAPAALAELSALSQVHKRRFAVQRPQRRLNEKDGAVAVGGAAAGEPGRRLFER
jgi:hypothetical protein